MSISVYCQPSGRHIENQFSVSLFTLPSSRHRDLHWHTKFRLNRNIPRVVIRLYLGRRYTATKCYPVPQHSPRPLPPDLTDFTDIFDAADEALFRKILHLQTTY